MDILERKGAVAARALRAPNRVVGAPDGFRFHQSRDEATLVPMGFGVGDLLAGKYRVEKIIGRGGMGVVFATRHVDLGELFAVKLVEGVDRSNGERLLREARASARLRGEHVVRLHDVGWLAEKTPFLVLELVRGESVAAELRARGPFPAGETALVLQHACLALAEAHASGLVHRDVKASNLLATKRPDGSRLIKLLDFGIAKLSDHGEDHRITADRATLGSPAYMSPEQIRDAHAVDARTDVWALGVLAQELFTGKPPFAASTTSGVLASIVADEPAPLPDSTPAALRAMITGCLVKSVERRFQNVAEVADALAPLLPDGAAIAQRVRSTSSTREDPREVGVSRDRESLALTTRDEPTYDPTEMSAEHTIGTAAAEARVEGARPSDAHPSASERRPPASVLASPWILPAVALPFAAALAMFASAGRKAPPPPPMAPVATSTTSAMPAAQAEIADAVPTAAVSPSASSAASAPLVAPVVPPPPKGKRVAPAASARGPRPSAEPPSTPLPAPNDLDRFGGRK